MTARSTAKATAKKAAGKAAPAKAAPKAAVKKAAPAKAAAKAPAKAPAKAAAKAPVKAAAKKAPSRKGPVPNRAGLTDKFLEQQRESLLSERESYLRQAESLKAEADQLAELREPGDVQFDEESGEGDTLAVERERDLALSAQALQQIDEIDHALTKLADGTYGLCEVSGQPIPKERLKAIPWARERVEYKVGGFSRR
jgi:RNA polymerase-binding transcription factor DksA